jgi:hypothetical protein
MISPHTLLHMLNNQADFSGCKVDCKVCEAHFPSFLVAPPDGSTGSVRLPPLG